MSNQIILWGTLIIPWLTLFFMPREDAKRYLASGFLTTLMSIIVQDVGITHGWWAIRETTYPLSVLPTYTYGVFPVLSTWIFKYTYGRFGLYFAVKSVINAVLAFFVFPWFASRGIIDFNAGLNAFIFASVTAIIVYGFQMWQEGTFARSESTSFSPNLQPAATKPLPKDQKHNTDNE